MQDNAELDRLLQELGHAHNRPVSSTVTLHYADRMGRVHPEDLRIAVDEWKTRDRFPSPAELLGECNIARVARLRFEANERHQRSGPPRGTVTPESVRARLAALRRVLADAKVDNPFDPDALAAEVAEVG